MNQLFFDVDSTLVSEETLDYALSLACHGNEATLTKLHHLTNAGMSGKTSLRESISARLKLFSLYRDDIEEAQAALQDQITPHMAELVHLLQQNRISVYALSGGFREIISPALLRLGIKEKNIHANTFLWEHDKVSGFDESNPLSRNGGKAEVIATLKGPEDEVIMIGDGITDFEAWQSGAADHFIGFGLVEQRTVVIDACKKNNLPFVRTIDELRQALDSIIK